MIWHVTVTASVVVSSRSTTVDDCNPALPAMCSIREEWLFPLLTFKASQTSKVVQDFSRSDLQICHMLGFAGPSQCWTWREAGKELLTFGSWLLCYSKSLFNVHPASFPPTKASKGIGFFGTLGGNMIPYFLVHPTNSFTKVEVYVCIDIVWYSSA